MEYRLKNTVSKDAFRYGYLLNKIYPYIRPFWGRIIINLIIAIPLGLLDGVVAFSLKPYMDLVINGNPSVTYTILGHDVQVQSSFAAIIPIAIILFAAFQGILK